VAGKRTFTAILTNLFTVIPFQSFSVIIPNRMTSSCITMYVLCKFNFSSSYLLSFKMLHVALCAQYPLLL